MLSKAKRVSTERSRAAVAVVAYNGGALVSSCVQALLDHSPRGTRVVVVDNGSRDSAVDRLVRDFEGIEVVRLPHNLGFAGGANVALDFLSADSSRNPVGLVGVINQDCIVARGWLEPLAEVLENRSVGAVGARLLAADGVTLEHAGGLVKANGLTMHIGRGVKSERAFRRRADVEYVSGAVLFLRPEVWLRYRPFDEGYFPAYFEEVEFCLRLRDAGLRVLYVPESRVVHRTAFSSGGPQSSVYLRRYHGSRMRFVARRLLQGRGSRCAFLAAELGWLCRLRDRSHLRIVLGAYRRLPAEMREAKLRRPRPQPS